MAALTRRWAIPALIAVAFAVAIAIWSIGALGSRGGSISPAPVTDQPPRSSETVPRVPQRRRTASDPAESAAADSARTALATDTAKPTASLEILIVSSDDGNPIEDARVRLPPKVDGWGMSDVDGSRGTPHDILHTDERGSVEFTVEPDAEHMLFVDVRGARSTQQDVAALASGEHRVLTVAVRSAFDVRFRGIVVDGATGDPLANATIALETMRSMYFEPVQTLTSASDGSFQLELPSWTEARLRIDLQGYAPTFLGPRASAGESEVEATIPLLRWATLVVEVVDPESRPVEHASVSVGQDLVATPPPNEPYALLGYASSYRTGEDGSCRDAFPPNVALDVEVAKGAARVKEPIRLSAGEERTLRLTLGRGCRIDGRALEVDRRPAAGLEVWLVPRGMFDTPGMEKRFLSYLDVDGARRADTDRDGRFVFDAVPAGDWWLGPAAAELGDTSDSAPLAILVHAIDDGHLAPELLVQRGLYIRGKVVDSDGAPVEGARVFCTKDGMTGIPGAESAADGTFTIGPLAPGEHTLSVLHMEGFGPSNIVRATPGGEAVVIVLYAGVAISGCVVDRSGVVVPRAQMQLTGPNGWAGSWTGADGRFEFSGLAPGSYGVAASDGVGACGRTEWLELASGTMSGVEVVIAEGAKLRVLLDAHGDFRVYQDGIAVGATVFGGVVWDEGPGFELLVPPGPVRVELLGDEPAFREVQAELGKVTVVSFGDGR